jgi:hypothetical protein
MPIEHAIWKIGATSEALTVTKLASGKDLEERDQYLTSNAQH